MNVLCHVRDTVLGAGAETTANVGAALPGWQLRVSDGRKSQQGKQLANVDLKPTDGQIFL